jgi:hypothetical protein
MRALLTTDDDGRFWCRSITPRYYPAPTDGPGGEILRAARRSVMRPQHVHFWFHADGYQPLITQLFLRDDTYIDCDVVFAVQDSLIADFVRHEPGVAPDGTFVDQPFVTLDWTFVMVSGAANSVGRARGYPHGGPRVRRSPREAGRVPTAGQRSGGVRRLDQNGRGCTGQPDPLYADASAGRVARGLPAGLVLRDGSSPRARPTRRDFAAPG